MGFGSPTPVSKPKPKASLPANSGSRWAATSTIQSSLGGSSNTAFAKTPTSYTAKSPSMTSSVGTTSTPVTKIQTPAPTPASIPDGFGDDDDLNFGNADAAGVDDDWGDNDDDLDDLLNA